VVVVQAGNQRYGVIVDQLLGQHQTVIKPLGRLFRSLRGMSGSSILGNGEVALIFDATSLSQWQPSRPARGDDRTRPAPTAQHPRRTSVRRTRNMTPRPSWIARLLAGAELQQAEDQVRQAAEEQPARPEQARAARERASSRAGARVDAEATLAQVPRARLDEVETELKVRTEIMNVTSIVSEADKKGDILSSTTSSSRSRSTAARN
jgi:hypothetical protein